MKKGFFRGWYVIDEKLFVFFFFFSSLHMSSSDQHIAKSIIPFRSVFTRYVDYLLLEYFNFRRKIFYYKIKNYFSLMSVWLFAEVHFILSAYSSRHALSFLILSFMQQWIFDYYKQKLFARKTLVKNEREHIANKS